MSAISRDGIVSNDQAPSQEYAGIEEEFAAAIDLFSVPVISSELERRGRLKADLIGTAAQCISSWEKGGAI